MELLLLSVALSNIIFGSFPLFLLISTNRYYGATFVFIAIITAIMMNVTRDIPDLLAIKYAKIFKRLDKITAHVTALYGVHLFCLNPEKSIIQILVPIFGVTILYTTSSIVNFKVFAVAQIIWHLLAYLSLYLAIPIIL